MALSGTVVVVGLLGIIVSVIASAFFSSSEIAVFSLKDHRLPVGKQLTDTDTADEGQIALERLRSDPHRLLVTILVANNFVNIAIGSIMTALLVEFFSSGFAIVLATVTASFVVLVFGDITPKSYGVANAESWALTVARPILYVQWVLYPVVLFFDKITRVLNGVIGGSSDIKRSYVTREEIEALVRTAEQLGVIQEDEQAMIQRIFRFSTTPVHEVMVPHDELHCIPTTGRVDNAIALCSEHHLRRLPVCNGSIDTITGYVDINDLLAKRESATVASDLSYPVIHVPESYETDELLADFLEEHVSMAIVVDETGATQGIVTVENLVEEIVGSVFTDGSGPSIIVIDRDTLSIRADQTIRDVTDKFGVDFPNIAGDQRLGDFLSARLDGPIRIGDTIEIDGLRLEVQSLREMEIQRVLISNKTGSHSVVSR
ncbi:hemolysin family protein [Halorubrum sp. HHNYT27]|uniref:hemolysin family protein n=1 Tax=Halorubrum sp. HHNYT27 TaxID=3402275 RepID=UPI003EB6D773